MRPTSPSPCACTNSDDQVLHEVATSFRYPTGQSLKPIFASRGCSIPSVCPIHYYLWQTLRYNIVLWTCSISPGDQGKYPPEQAVSTVFRLNCVEITRREIKLTWACSLRIPAPHIPGTPGQSQNKPTLKSLPRSKLARLSS